MDITGMPEFEFTIQFKSVGEFSKKEYSGVFVYALPTIAQLKEISNIKNAMVGDAFAKLDAYTNTLYEFLSELKVCLVKFPEWWKESGFGEELRDTNIVVEVFTQCLLASGKLKAKENE
jgi:uncharacterized ion transporter superfamily protein YfcC